MARIPASSGGFRGVDQRPFMAVNRLITAAEHRVLDELQGAEPMAVGVLQDAVALLIQVLPVDTRR